jgi:hypothetical protein
MAVEKPIGDSGTENWLMYLGHKRRGRPSVLHPCSFFCSEDCGNTFFRNAYSVLSNLCFLGFDRFTASSEVPSLKVARIEVYIQAMWTNVKFRVFCCVLLRNSLYIRVIVNVFLWTQHYFCRWSLLSRTTWFDTSVPSSGPIYSYSYSIMYIE